METVASPFSKRDFILNFARRRRKRAEIANQIRQHTMITDIIATSAFFLSRVNHLEVMNETLPFQIWTKLQCCLLTFTSIFIMTELGRKRVTEKASECLRGGFVDLITIRVLEMTMWKKITNPLRFALLVVLLMRRSVWFGSEEKGWGGRDHYLMIIII